MTNIDIKMSKIANVIFPYTPTNVDELELKVGDKIEVIGVEEEGWWRGKLKGREGVFPSNFVQVTETTSQANNSNKLNSLFGSLVNNKNTISSNSLNNITSNNSNNNSLNNNNNNNSTSSNNLIMNNTHPASLPSDELRTTEESSTLHSSSVNETTTRPKPLRAMGYGDIFVAGAKTKPLPADPTAGAKTAVASERPNLANSLQRPIPKKPPPPAPAGDIGSTNGSSSDQAPALPPKPGNSYVPYLQQRPLPQPGGGVAGQRTPGRKQARVIYAYTPSNSDELAMQVGDIIDVIDMDIEDQGWWKGELNGKIGVFPDNFVQLIVPEAPIPVSAPAQDWQNSSRLSGSAASNQSINTSTSTSDQPNSTRIKSVFAGTPKGFSKELESNLEKHSNPASFLSLKRNKLQQQMSTVSSGLPSDTPSLPMETAANTASLFNPSSTTSDLSEPRQNGHTHSLLETSPGKLNHITANRAKGPTRRPPKNLLNKRNQLNENPNTDTLGSKDIQQPPSVGLPTLNSPHSPLAVPAVAAAVEARLTHSDIKSPSTSIFATPVASEPVSPLNSKVETSPSSNNHSGTPDQGANQVIVPKTNIRAINQSPVIAQPQSQQSHQTHQQQQQDTSMTRNKSTTSTSSSSSTPPWMVELRKTNAEKKRDPPISSASVAVSVMEEPIVVSQPLAPVVTAAPMVTPPIVVTSTAISTTAISKSLSTSTNTIPNHTATSLTNSTNEITTSKFDSIFKQISQDVHNEIDELKSEVKQLREEFRGINELKESLEAMKVELRTCQSATESQRRYIKDLVNNLADERKRIAAMQVEIDGNLK